MILDICQGKLGLARNEQELKLHSMLVDNAYFMLNFSNKRH